jgi:AAA domain, putative AbiEii toxin, Type IV TA system/AAA ATPase domain
VPTLLEATVRNFQSVVEPQTIRFEPNITFFVGRNDVGKSAFLRAMLVFVEQQAPGRSGFSFRLQRIFRSEDLLRWVNLPPEGDTNRPMMVKLRETLSGGQSVTVAEEFHNTTDEDDGASVNTMKLRHLTLEPADASWRINPNDVPEWDGHALPEGDPLKVAGGHLRNVLMRFPFKPTYLAPKRAAASSFQGKTHLSYADELAPDGSNLTVVWANLTLNKRPIVEEAETFLRRAFPNITRINAHSSPISAGSTPQAELEVDYDDGRSVPLRDCGTGIEQLLILATGVLTAASPTVFLIDEPHGYLHAEAERRLVEFIDAHPRHQYIVATHSPTLLRSKPINHGRLFRFQNGETRVANVEGRDDILSALDLTPIDLWMDRGIVWVEGPTEEAVLTVATASASDLKSAAFAIKALPDASRFASAGARTAASAFEALQKVAEAVTPLPVGSSFIFDRDERNEAAMEELKRLANRHTYFLPYREIENAFLRADLLHAALVERAAQLQLEAPAVSDVEAALNQELAKVGDERLYRQRPADGHPDSTRVVGSEVLERLYWEFLKARYDKVSDGKRLAEVAAARAPEALEPLTKVLREATAP